MENEQNKTLQNSNETEVEQYVGQMTDGNEKNDTYAKIDDKSDENKQKKERNDRSFSVSLIAKLAILSAMAVVLLYIEFPLLPATPWLKLNVSDVPTLLASFMFGPISGIVVNGVKVGVCLLIRGTSTAFVGDLANFLVGCSFVLPAAICYQATLSKKGAVLSLALGTAVMSVFGSMFNAWYLIPKFSELFGMPMDAIISMGTAVNSAITSLPTLVLFAVVPFNILKGVLVSILTMLLYKRVEEVFFRRKKSA